MPQDLLFSLWFFYWVLKGQYIVQSVFGFYSGANWAHVGNVEQSRGAYFAVVLLALWGGRRHLWACCKAAWRGRLEFELDPFSPRVAFIGIVGGIIGLIFFSRAAGMALWVACVFFIIYYVLSTAITRVRAEFGLPIHDAWSLGPDRGIIHYFGTRRLGFSNLTVMTLYHWFNYTYASHPMPHQLEGFKMGDRFHAGRPFYRRLAWIFMLATVVSALVTFGIMLDGYYRYGNATGHYTGYGGGVFGHIIFRRLEFWLKNPTESNFTVTGFVGIGFGIATVLYFLRRRFFWWSLHPLGYAIAPSWGAQMWSSFMFAWFLKWCILRLGGVGTYRRAVPFFLGIILGEFLVGSLWNWVSIFFNVATYQFARG